MNPDAASLARATFLQAAQLGPSREPASVATELAKDHVQDGGVLFDASELEKAVDAEFPWRNQLVFQSRQPEPDESDAWTQAVRWILQSLLTADMNAAGGEQRVRVLLSALYILDVGCQGLNAISYRFVGTHVPNSIISMLQRLRLVTEYSAIRSKEWLQELYGQVEAGNFEMLRQAKHVLQPNFRSDIWACVFLLWKLQPEELARLIDSRKDVLLAVIVCTVLDANAPLFALQVESVAFKFFSLSWLVRLKDTCPEVNSFDVLEQLLLQVAKTPQWKGWLHATYEHPAVGSGESKALAEALTKLAEPRWRDFIFATALSTIPSSAQAVSDILMLVSNKLGPVKTASIWSDAFERWDAWDYGKGEESFFLCSPQVCAFDFPVAMYYAQMPSAERDALERELHNEIVHVEQQWFASESELSSERNRLASRLRLVQHGTTLASGGKEVLLPPLQPDSEYAEIRYRYFDVNKPLSTAMGR